jgi:hypothetical protein
MFRFGGWRKCILGWPSSGRGFAELVVRGTELRFRRSRRLTRFAGSEVRNGLLPVQECSVLEAWDEPRPWCQLSGRCLGGLVLGRGLMRWARP